MHGVQNGLEIKGVGLPMGKSVRNKWGGDYTYYMAYPHPPRNGIADPLPSCLPFGTANFWDFPMTQPLKASHLK